MIAPTGAYVNGKLENREISQGTDPFFVAFQQAYLSINS
jgi:hypothetical protein